VPSNTTVGTASERLNVDARNQQPESRSQGGIVMGAPCNTVFSFRQPVLIDAPQKVPSNTNEEHTDGEKNLTGYYGPVRSWGEEIAWRRQASH
jgi:hypothetical protein